MNMANTGFTAWYPLDEAAGVMSRHTGVNIHRHDLLGAALTTRLPLVVCVPSGTKDSEGQPIDEGLWDLLVEGSRGQPAQQQLAHEISPDIPNVDGMWVEKDGQYRQLRPAGYPDTSHGVTPDECVLGVLETVLDDFFEKLKDKLPPRLSKESPTPPAPKSESVSAEWTDVTITVLSDHRVQMKIGDRMLSSCTCEELEDAGFWNRHAKRPTKAWDALLRLAEGNGTVATSFEDRRRVEIRMSEIRKKLRAYLTSEGIEISDSDPLPYDKHTRTYTATFTIGVGTNFK